MLSSQRQPQSHGAGLGVAGLGVVDIEARWRPRALVSLFLVVVVTFDVSDVLVVW